MQKWEYLVLRGEQSGSHRFMPRFTNEQELRDWKKIPLHSLMNQLGADGWELVGATGYQTGSIGNELLFKRPRP